MKTWLVCFDIEDNRARRQVGKRLLQHGQRVQRSVFEVLLNGRAERDALASELNSLLDPAAGDDLRFYPLCTRCRSHARRSDGQPAAQFPRHHIV